MGTSIIVHTEIKIAGEWHHYGCPRIERNYRLFAKMANVRNENGIEIYPLSPERGLPKDATKLTQIAFGHDEYPVMWLNCDQVKDLVQWYEQEYRGDPWGLEGEFDFVFHNGWASIPNTLVEDCRFIFWFD